MLLAARGPLARVLARLVAELSPRPVIVTGLPGISIPATRRALQFRAQCDLFVLHSHPRDAGVRRLSRRAAGLTQRFALSRLPFAESRSPARPRGDGGTDLVFAAQAIVPRERADRIRVAQLLVAAAEADPVAARRRQAARGGGREADPPRTSTTTASCSRAWRAGSLPPNLVVSTGPMARALDTAEGLVTVSSTAAIEAIARGIPVIALDTFGVSDQLINPVFVGSGLFAGEDAVIAREFRHPDAGVARRQLLPRPGAGRLVRAAPGAGRVSVAPDGCRRSSRSPAVAATRATCSSARWPSERKDRTPEGVAVMIVGWPLRFALRGFNRVRRLVRGPAADQVATGLDADSHQPRAAMPIG